MLVTSIEGTSPSTVLGAQVAQRRAATLQAARGGDPVDWLLVATAQERRLRIVSKDARIRQCGLADVVWRARRAAPSGRRDA